MNDTYNSPPAPTYYTNSEQYEWCVRIDGDVQLVFKWHEDKEAKRQFHLAKVNDHEAQNIKLQKHDVINGRFETVEEFKRESDV